MLSFALRVYVKRGESVREFGAEGDIWPEREESNKT
jgi:hypothetical protein